MPTAFLDPLFPTSLGRPLNNMITRPGSTFKKSQFDHGVRYKKTYCNTYLVDVTFRMTDAQLGVLKDFYYNYLDFGVLPFLAEWNVEGDKTMKMFRFYEIYNISREMSSEYSVVKFTVEKI